MAYRDEQRCHLCGVGSTETCPSCGNGVCAAHTLAGLAAAALRPLRRRLERLGPLLSAELCERCLEREQSRGSLAYIPIYRDSDPVQAQMLAEALADDGFAVRLIGSQNASLLGAGQHIFEQRIEVLEPQAEEAQSQIAALLGAGEALAVDGAADAQAWSSEAEGSGSEGEGEAEGSGDEEDGAQRNEVARSLGLRLPVRPRARALAAGIAFVFPGAAHLYVGRAFVGLWMTTIFALGAWRALAAMQPSALVPLVGAVLFDLVGAQLAINPANCGVPQSPWLQILEGGAVAGALFGLSAVL